jgi:selenocysteine-specific elongation factor
VHVVATAGHVDHGKSTLVLALTGTDPDRLEEEKRRGLTIDLGFAWTALGSGHEIGFVDVPGHVRFIKNMLAGVGAVDACLFVVAATEGWKPQSEEHLRILEMLGVAHGVVALTKVDGLDPDARALARLDVEEHLAGSFLETAPVIEVDAPAGLGVDELRRGLEALVARAPTAADRRRPRLWVDRSFAARGAGTVVTGTLTGGPLEVDDEMSVVGPGPLGRTARARVRVRALQSHHRVLAIAEPGRRLAVNLTGAGHAELWRGDAVVRAGQWQPTDAVDCSLRVLASVGHDVGRTGAYQAYVGSGEHAVRLRVIGGRSIAPGACGLVRLRLPCRLPLLPGDRYVLRESGRSETVGGGEVLDVAPVLPVSRAAPDRSVARVVAERGWVDVGLLERLTGERVRPDVGDHWVVDPPVLDRARRDVVDRVSAAGPLGLDLTGLDAQERAVAEDHDELCCAGGRVTLAAADAEALADHPYLSALRASLFAPPSPAEWGVDRAELREMVRRGLVVESDGCYFAPVAVQRGAEAAARLLRAEPDGLTVSRLRQELGTTRKYLVPLLSHLDATGVTRRRGDVRVAGPRLPAVD